MAAVRDQQSSGAEQTLSAGDRDGSESHQAKQIMNPMPSAQASHPTNFDDIHRQEPRDGSPSKLQPRARPVRQSSIPRTGTKSQDRSPNRGNLTPTSNIPSVPSAASIQRALSAAKIPQLQPSLSDTAAAIPPEQRVPENSRHEDVPQWPISPRLKSPPPASRKTPPARKTDPHTLPKVSKPSPSSALASGKSAVRVGSESDESAIQSGPKSTGRAYAAGSTLEPVDEASVPSSAPADSESFSGGSKITDLETSFSTQSEQSKQLKSPSTGDGADSGAESVSERSTAGTVDDREHMRSSLTMTSSRPPVMPSKPSFTSLKSGKSKASVEPASRTMTVETETVSSVPQLSLGVGGVDRGASGRSDASGSVKAKPSSETIRPKKDKKRTIRKPPSVNASTVSSKADIFEAKVASAVDEASSSDSDETFVYESNPPEMHPNREFRHHSRTPSTTSMASQADGNLSRYRTGQRDGQHSVTGKRSMKFTNSAYNNNLDGENGLGSGRGSTRASAATPRHHHIGRYGRGGHTGLFDNDSPFTQAGRGPGTTKSGTPINGSRLSRPSSPRVNGYRNGTPTRKGEVYDPDLEDAAADDERTPLMNSVRINRARHARRPNNASLRQMEYLEHRNRGFFARFGACLVVTLLLLVLVFGAAAFVLALTKPLTEVTLKHIENVLASEQEIILDLNVEAINRNLLAVTVADLNVDIFARSGYVHAVYGSQSKPVKRRGGGVDEGNDPIEDPDADPRTMLLGRVYDFDSPLVFEPSPLHKRSSSSVGQIRLSKPGNRTEQGGSARWERVLEHPFDLTVRGNIKYQLPLTSRFQSAKIQSTKTVTPDQSSGGKPVNGTESR